MIPYCPSQIIIQEDSWRDSTTYEILEKLKGISTRTIEDITVLLPGKDRASSKFSYPKNTLVLMRYPANFVKLCQGSGAEICCNCFIVSYVSNCHFECTYCVLQSYLNNPAMIIYTNIGDLMDEVRETLSHSPNRLFRIGTGELSDSLALDHITCYTQRLVPFFASLPNGILELKTKSDQIENLKGLDHGGHTIVSWSMNTKRICHTEEFKTSTFEARLAAARQCQEWDYKLGFHFDPLIHYPGWETEYQEAVKEIFSTIDPQRIAWISLGALRFTPHLRTIIRKRFPKSAIPYGEFVPGHHGKLRYFRPIREEMYRRIRSWIHEEASQVFVYLCMENRTVWEQSFGEAPNSLLSEQMDALVCVANQKPSC